ncbi:MAG: hypothetical protein LRY55_11005 [Leadbetterella sp.]|nr:hypothetical protein [Leadbetterella sp.]
MRFVSDFPAFDANAGLRKVVSVGTPSLSASSISPKAQAEIAAFNAFIQHSDQPSFFISSKNWELLDKGANPIKTWLPDGHEVHGFVFCLALKRWELVGKEVVDIRKTENAKLFGYAYFRIRTILKDTVSGKVHVEQSYIGYTDVKEALADNSESNHSQVKFLTPADQLLIDLINSEVIKKGDDTNLKNTFFQGVDTSFEAASKEEKPEGRKIHGVFSNEGGIFGHGRIKTIREEKGTRVSIARRIRSFDKEKDKAEGLPDLSRREIYYHFKINPEYETDVPCPLPRVCDSEN